MKHNILVLAALFLMFKLACTNDNQPMYGHKETETKAASLNDAPIKIVINPESRVSVALAGALPRPERCGTAVELAVKIVNQGFVTARLEAEMVDPPEGVTLDFHPAALRGEPEEFRKLRIILTKPGAADLTIAFRAHNIAPDLGGRDRLHFLFSCRGSAEGPVQ